MCPLYDVQRTVDSRLTKISTMGVVEVHNDHTYMPNAYHEFFPKNSTVTQARDAVIRLRDSVLCAAADSEVVLPIYDPHERCHRWFGGECIGL